MFTFPPFYNPDLGFNFLRANKSFFPLNKGPLVNTAPDWRDQEGQGLSQSPLYHKAVTPWNRPGPAQYAQR